MADQAMGPEEQKGPNLRPKAFYVARIDEKKAELARCDEALSEDEDNPRLTMKREALAAHVVELEKTVQIAK